MKGCDRKEGLSEQIEKTKQEKQSYRRRTQIQKGKISPTAEDDGEYIGHWLYGILVIHFHTGRKKCVEYLFEYLFYCFTSWTCDSKMPAISKKTLHMEWVKNYCLLYTSPSPRDA